MDNELDELPKFINGNSPWARFRRAFVRFRLVSETDKRSNHHLRSQGAIANEKHRHLNTYFYMIHPFSHARQYWELLMCPVFLIQFILIPLDVALFRIPREDLITSMRYRVTRNVLDYWFVLDMLLNFFTGYFNKTLRQTELSPYKVAFHYCTTTFVCDCISSFPTHWELFFKMRLNGDRYLFLQILSLFKLFRFNTFIKYCNMMRENYEIHYTVFKIAMVIIITLLYFHLVTCCLMLWKVYAFGLLFAPLRGDETVAWNNTKLRYHVYFYKSLLIIRNAGHGALGEEIHTNVLGLLLIACFWTMSKLLEIFVIGKIMQILKATTSSRQKYVEMVRQLKQYMYHRQLPEYMQRRLLKYYEFRFQKSYFRENEILSTISGHLRQEITMHSCQKLVENVAFFKNIPFALLVRIVTCLRSEIFLVNDVIVRAATPGNCMFFIASGTVAVFTTSGKEICHLEDGAHFGEIALVMRDELRVASVVAVDVCELYRLDRKEFIRAIHPYPDLLDNIQRIATDRMEKTTMMDEHDRREMASKRLY